MKHLECIPIDSTMSYSALESTSSPLESTPLHKRDDELQKRCVRFWRRVCALCVVMGLVCVSALAESKTLTLAISAPLGAINPHAYGSNAMSAQNLVYEGLVKLSPSGEIVPSLATSWQVSDDGKRYVFALRKGVRFSNGEQFNADAVLVNFTSLLRYSKPHSWVGLIHAIDSITKRDDYTIILSLKYPYSPTLSDLAFVRPFRFLAPSAFPKDLDTSTINPKPIGTGAYMLESHTKSAEIFTRNPYYTDRESGKVPYFDKVIARIIADPNAKFAALQTGQVDVIYGRDSIPLDMFRHSSTIPHITPYISKPSSTISLVLNPNSPKLAQKSAREALMHAVDRKSIVASVYGENAQLANALYGKNTALLAKLSSQALPEYNCQQAQKFHTITATNEPLSLLYNGKNPTHKMLAELIQAKAKACGIAINLRPAESSFYTRYLVAGAFDMAFTETWGAPYEPLSHLYSMQFQGHIEYALLLHLPQRTQFLEYVNKAVLATNQNAVLANTQNALNVLAQTYTILPLAYHRNTALMRSNIGGVEMGVMVAEIPIHKWYRKQ